ncbi:hypothetical protein VPHD528_0113 [Vibrio phage D528]
MSKDIFESLSVTKGTSDALVEALNGMGYVIGSDDVDGMYQVYILESGGLPWVVKVHVVDGIETPNIIGIEHTTSQWRKGAGHRLENIKPYVPANQKPPLGVTPRHIHEQDVATSRIYEILDASKRYMDANLIPPIEWGNELADLYRTLAILDKNAK